MKPREPKRWKLYQDSKVHFLGRSRQMTGCPGRAEISLCGVISDYGGILTTEPITCKNCRYLWARYTEMAWTPDAE